MVQAARLVRALGAEAAGLAQIPLVDEPDGGAHNILAGGDVRDDGLQDLRESAVLRNRDHSSREIDTVHIGALRLSGAPLAEHVLGPFQADGLDLETNFSEFEPTLRLGLILWYRRRRRCGGSG